MAKLRDMPPLIQVNPIPLLCGPFLLSLIWPLINMQTHSVDKPTVAPPFKLTHLNTCILGIRVLCM